MLFGGPILHRRRPLIGARMLAPAPPPLRRRAGAPERRGAAHGPQRAARLRRADSRGVRGRQAHGAGNVTMGPVQLLVLAVAGDGDGLAEIQAELDRLRAHDTIRLLDLVFVAKTEAGETSFSSSSSRLLRCTLHFQDGS